MARHLYRQQRVISRDLPAPARGSKRDSVVASENLGLALEAE